MPDRYARVWVHCRYADWPGGLALCVVADAGKLGRLWFLQDADGRRMELRPYSYRAWHGHH